MCSELAQLQLPRCVDIVDIALCLPFCFRSVSQPVLQITYDLRGRGKVSEVVGEEEGLDFFETRLVGGIGKQKEFRYYI